VRAVARPSTRSVAAPRARHCHFPRSRRRDFARSLLRGVWPDHTEFWTAPQKQIEPYIPISDKTQRTDDSLSSSAFQWDEQRDEYRCAEGHALRSEWRPFATARSHVTRGDPELASLRGDARYKALLRRMNLPE